MVELLSSSDCFKKYGSPELEIGVIHKRLYCNKDLIAPLTIIGIYILISE